MPAGTLCTSSDILTSRLQTEEGLPQVWCSLTEVLLHQTCLLIGCHYAYLYSAALSDMYAGFIHSDTRVWKVLLHQVRILVCYESTRHVYRLGAAPKGL